MVCLTIFTVLFVYGIRLAGADLSIDTEIMLNDQQEVLDSWIGIGRFGLVFTKKLFGFARLVPWTENLMMILALDVYKRQGLHCQLGAGFLLYFL